MADRFAPGDNVWITYPNSALANRRARVVEDNGGKTITVKWRARYERGPRKRPYYSYGPEHVQRIPRERIKPHPRWKESSQ